jgi:hypothetical protein
MITNNRRHFTEHDKLLFRWGSRDIEEGGGQRKNGELPPLRLGSLTEIQRKQYFERIEQVLNPEKGLYAKVPDEFLGGQKEPWKPTLPCLSFTEISLASALDHCHLYGRLGFGFTKQAILNRSGRPVAYLPGGVQDPTVKRLLDIREVLDLGGDSKAVRAKAYFDYLRHFYKRMRFPAVQRDPDSVPPKVAPKPARKPRSLYDMMKFPALRPFPYLEEQEWRIVISRPEKFSKASGRGEDPAVWFPVEPGHELMVMVVPDNLILHQVFTTKPLRDKVSKIGRPPIQIISWESIKCL